MRKDKIIIVFYKNKPMTISELSKEIDNKLNYQTLRNRVAKAFREGNTVFYEGLERAVLTKNDLFPVRAAKFDNSDGVIPKRLLKIMNRAFGLLHNGSRGVI